MFKYLASAAALAALAFAATASAETVTLQGSSIFNTNGNATVTLHDAGYYGGQENGQAGAFALKSDGSVLPATFDAFCLSIFRNQSNGPYDYTATSTPFAGQDISSKVSLIQDLYDTGYAGLNLSSATDSVGFQLALWEIVNETTGTFDVKNDLTKGSFYVTTTLASALTKANSLLAGLTGPDTGHYALTFLQSGGRDQNLVTAAPVPVPAAGFLLVSAIGGLAAAKRRRRAA